MERSVDEIYGTVSTIVASGRTHRIFI